MKKEDFIYLFADIDEEYIIKAKEVPKKGRTISSKKWFALIAAIIVIGAMATIAIAESFDISFSSLSRRTMTDQDGNKMEYSRYSITYIAENVFPEEFSNEIQKIAEEQNSAWKKHLECNTEECSGHGELGISKKFYYISDALEYIGCERIEIPDLNARIYGSGVMVLGSPDLVPKVRIYWYCENTEIDFRCDAEVYIGKKNDNKEKKTGLSYIGEEKKFYEERRFNKNGLEYIVVYSDVKEKYFSVSYDKNTMERVKGVTAYIVKNDVLYTFHDSISELYNKDGSEVDEVTLSNIKKDEKDVVEKYLKLWADSF